MKIGSILLAATLLLSFGVPNAAASCAADTSGIAVGDHYVGTDASLWEETNNVAGLQRDSCEDDNGRLIAKDTRLL